MIIIRKINVELIKMKKQLAIIKVTLMQKAQ